MKTIFLILILVTTIPVSAAMVKRTAKLTLSDTSVQVNIYEKAGANITFIAPHHNEGSGLALAKEFVASYGGRLIEIESYDSKGLPARYLRFTHNGKTYSIDPNRIFTENGRTCGTPAEIIGVVSEFSQQLLTVLFPADGKTLREGEKFIVAVHNNADVDSKSPIFRAGDLTAFSFIKGAGSHGGFQDQADGAFLSNLEDDRDNFIFVSTPQYIGYFARQGFNVILQKSAESLISNKCSVDDGSLSVYAAQNAVPYICLEADGINGNIRQRLMFEAVYQLLRQYPR